VHAGNAHKKQIGIDPRNTFQRAGADGDHRVFKQPPADKITSIKGRSTSATAIPGLWVTTVQAKSAGRADHFFGGGPAVDNHHLSRLDQRRRARAMACFEAICTFFLVSIGAMAAETGSAPPWTRCSLPSPPARVNPGESSLQRR
jgi:hypothetical protein